MPRDKNGVVADVIADSASTISRMNVGRVYEAYLGATSRDNRARLTQALTERFGAVALNQPTPEAVEYARVYLRGLYAMLNSDMTDFLDSLDPEELHHHVKEVVHVGLHLYYPTDNERNITDVIQDIDNSAYKPQTDKLTYVNGVGEIVETRDDFQIGVLYFMFLEKIGNLYSAVSSAKVNNFGFPVKGANVDKHKYPHSQTPTKILAETENRILISHVGEQAVADMIDLALNPTSHKTVYKQIIQSPVVYNSTFDVDRKDINYGQTKSLQTLNHIFTAAGFTMNYESEN
jgi:hypothetical protein